MFFRIRGYISTRRKQGVSATDALPKAFQGEIPNFAQQGETR